MGVAAAANILGSNVVGSLAVSSMVIVTIPFVGLAVAALAYPGADLSVLFKPDPSLWPTGREGWYFFITLVLWNTCGYDSAGMVAAEVTDGAK